MVAYIFNWVNMAKFPFYLLFRKGISKKQQQKKVRFLNHLHLKFQIQAVRSG